MSGGTAITTAVFATATLAFGWYASHAFLAHGGAKDAYARHERNKKARWRWGVTAVLIASGTIAAFLLLGVKGK
jgi:hypothetical protein